MRVPARRLLIASVAAAFAAGSIPAYAAMTSPGHAPRVAVLSAGDNAIGGQYIVTMKHTRQRLSRPISLPVLNRFDGGFAARMTAAQLKKVQADPNVASIEQDQIMKADSVQANPTWGLDRIDQHKLPLSHSYGYTHTGAGVDAYVIDTGIQTSLSQFGGRANTVYGGTDCNGHGTHVAGIIGSRSYGVAKSVRLHGVRVLGCNGEGSTSAVIAGVDWVRKHHGARSVANLSLGGPKSLALNNAITALSKSGVFVAVAAGNESVNACDRSPASAGYVEAAAASASNDHRADFSNYGRCVDVYAPGVNIKSTYLGGTAYGSGTSMASPFVAGVAALYKSAYGQRSFSTIQTWISGHASRGVIIGNPAGTPNALLYKSTL